MSFYGLLHALMLVSAPVAVEEVRPDTLASEDIVFAPISIEVEQDFLQGVIVQERVMIRVPARRASVSGFRSQNRSPMPQPRRVVWQEKKAPRCIAASELLGVQFVQDDSIDLLNRDQSRVRATLKRNCRAENFYSGFYMKPTKDGMICADRDILQSRSGARCEVERFRKLVPVAQD